MQDYEQIISIAMEQGIGEEAIIRSAKVIASVMRYIQEDDQALYESYLREIYESIFGKHYNEDMAMEDVSSLRCIDKEGCIHIGEHWTCDEIEFLTRDLQFPVGTNGWDKYVAYNYAFADFSNLFDEATILGIAYSFYFSDTKSQSQSKIWDYVKSLKKSLII